MGNPLLAFWSRQGPEDERRARRARLLAAAARTGARRRRPSSRDPIRLPTSASDHPRWNDTVSTTSSTTETTLASSAPPDSDTTLAVHAAVRPAEET